MATTASVPSRPRRTRSRLRRALLALDLAREEICQVFDYYGHDVGGKFDRLQEALERAAYADDGDS